MPMMAGIKIDTTGTMFAVAGAGSSNTDLYYVNMATGELIDCMITEPMFMSLTVDANGTIYAMAASEELSYDPVTGAGEYTNALLYTLDVRNGTYEVFMDTGYKSNMLASMAYDHDTGYIYWTGLCQGIKYESALYLIDPADKSCNALGTIGRTGAQVTCLMVFADAYPEEPTTLSNLALTTTLLEIGEGATITLETFATPAGVDVNYTWTSADESIATVDENGAVTGVSAGTTTISVTADDGTNTYTAFCTVIVYGADDYFITYNHTAGGFAKISRPDSTIVTQYTQDEDAAPVTALAMINGILYGYDAEGNLFSTTEADDFVRNYIGNCGITVAEPYEEHARYTASDAEYGYDYLYTPAFTVRDMAYDPVNNRLLVLGTETLNVYVEYWYESPSYSTRYEYANDIYELQGGCKIYTVDMETGALEALCTMGGKEFPMHGFTMMTVTDDGQVYAYSYYLDYISKVDLETGLFEDLVTFQNMGLKGSSDNDLMAMTYDAGTNALMMLFTTNGNAHSIYKFDLKSQSISFVGYVGEVTINYGYAYGDYFGGLVLNQEHECQWTEVDSKDATCTEDGYITYECVCGETYTETVPAKGHSHAVVDSKDATCTEDGYVTYECECGDTYTETVLAHGHSFVDGVCQHCGEVDPDYVAPDTGDSIFTAVAAALISMLGVVALIVKKKD